MAARISLGMIVRNEGRTLSECLLSVAPHVDEIVIGLGGESTDNTEQILKEFIDDGYNIKLLRLEWHDDFSEARNEVLEATTGEYFLWLDGDDILVGADKLRGYTETMPNVDMFYMGYDYSRDENGINNCYLVRERLVKRHPEMEVDYRWVGTVHEVLIAQWEPTDSVKLDDVVVIHHKPPGKHDPDRNLKILLQQLEESEPEPDPRILAYLGSELAGRGNVDSAITFWQRFVKVSGWDEEKYQTNMKLSAAYLGREDFTRAFSYAQQGLALKPGWPDAYFAIAKVYAAQGNFGTAIEYLRTGTSKEKPETFLIINQLEYTYEPAVLLASCYAASGDYEMAFQNYQQAYSIKQDETVRQQLLMIQDQLEQQKVEGAFLTLREHLGRHDEWLKVRRLFGVVPKDIEQKPRIQETWQRTMQQTAHIDDPSVMEEFYTGNPHWTPIPEELITKPDWLEYPRMAFALGVARRLNANQIVDWGCSDGFIALPLARELGTHVTGFDLDPRCVELATLRAKEWGVDARFEVGNIEKFGGWEGPPADLALLFEVIEHVIDPAKTLERVEQSAKHVAITTPYLAWERGHIPAWDKLEPKGHLRIFDNYDLEAILTPRGRIWNLYKQPFNDAGWLFADYEVGATTDKSIMIGAMGSIEKWGPNKLQQEGLGGSETAVIKLGESFAKDGHRVIVYNDTDSPGYYNGVCYRPPDHWRPEVKSDAFIAWRWPEAADHAIRTNCLVLWMHDTDAGDRLTKTRAEAFDYIVVLSEWHKKFMQEKYPFLLPENTKGNVDKLVTIGNGIDFSRFEKKVKKNPKKVVYSSSPDRGLDVILEHIWPKVVEKVPEAELHVYYGWDNYDKFMKLYPQLSYTRKQITELFVNSKNVVQHGRIPQDRLARELQEAVAWLYPTYFTETYCITAVEAQLAGAIPVTNHLAGLAETVKSGIVLEGDVRDSNTQDKYVESLVHVLTMSKEERKGLYKLVRENAPAVSWQDRAKEWTSMMFEGAVSG